MYDPSYTNSTTASGTEEFLEEFQDKISKMYEKIGTSATNGSLYGNAPVRAAFFIAYVNGVPSDVLSEIRAVLNGQGTYISSTFSQERLLPTYYLMKFCGTKRTISIEEESILSSELCMQSTA